MECIILGQSVVPESLFVRYIIAGCSLVYLLFHPFNILIHSVHYIFDLLFHQNDVITTKKNLFQYGLVSRYSSQSGVGCSLFAMHVLLHMHHKRPLEVLNFRADGRKILTVGNQNKIKP